MFEHALLLLQIFDLASGGLLTCLLSFSLYMFDRSYAPLLLFSHMFDRCSPDERGQEMTSVQQIAKMICPARRGAGLDSETKRSSSTNWPFIS